MIDPALQILIDKWAAKQFSHLHQCPCASCVRLRGFMEGLALEVQAAQQVRDAAMELPTDVIQPDGSLYSLGWYLSWKHGDSTATLDGQFTADELEAIARHMRAAISLIQGEETT